ncbi:MAG: cold shock domain-containing protein [Nitrospinae bacterium]|nr:cold shock domain-containing protein [Nitrospinota bacterium]
MATGTIKRVFKDRGYGFIRTPEGQEVFFHRTGLRNARLESLTEGDPVEFEVESSPKGPRAVNIQVAAKAQ